jgi:heavy metal response regulator
MRILIIEDEEQLINIMKRRLKEEGYAVDLAMDGKEGLNFAEAVNYDCIVLDIMLPGIDGFYILKRLRARKVITPILVLTAKDTVLDKVTGLDSGADDYITKPFSFDELLARIRALLRRKVDKKESILRISDLTLDPITREVHRGGSLIELTSKEYAILEYLLRNTGKILTKSQIAEHVWNYDFEYNSNIVEVYIRYLRRKLDDDFKNKLIHTVRGAGYTIKVKK